MLEENTRAQQLTHLGKEERGILSQKSGFYAAGGKISVEIPCVEIPPAACAIEWRTGMWMQLVQPKAVGTNLQYQEE